MHIDLSGKHAVITGSTKGIGFAIAAGLAACGAHVVINGRSEAAVKEAKARLLADVPKAKLDGVAADLATAAGVDTFLRAVPATDILVNNLGIFEPKPFEEIGDADWLRFFETNVMSGIRCRAPMSAACATRTGAASSSSPRSPASTSRSRWCTTA